MAKPSAAARRRTSRHPRHLRMAVSVPDRPRPPMRAPWLPTSSRSTPFPRRTHAPAAHPRRCWHPANAPARGGGVGVCRSAPLCRAAATAVAGRRDRGGGKPPPLVGDVPRLPPPRRGRTPSRRRACRQLCSWMPNGRSCHPTGHWPREAVASRLGLWGCELVGHRGWYPRATTSNPRR